MLMENLGSCLNAIHSLIADSDKKQLLTLVLAQILDNWQHDIRLASPALQSDSVRLLWRDHFGRDSSMFRLALLAQFEP